jgi:hypothetical protein
MARVTQNVDLKEREKEKVHERNIHLGEFVSYAYYNPSLAPNCRSYGSEYNDVITWGRSPWVLRVDRSGCSMTHFSGLCKGYIRVRVILGLG